MTKIYRIKLEELRKLLLSEQKKETYESVDKILDQIKAFSDDELRDLYNGLSDMRNKRNYEKKCG